MNKTILIVALLSAVQMTTHATEPMITRHHSVLPSIIDVFLPPEAHEESPNAEFIELGEYEPNISEKERQAYIKAFLARAGLLFPAGSSIYYNKAESTLIMRNTEENHGVLESILARHGVIYKQVEVVIGLFSIPRQKSRDLVEGKRISAQFLASALDSGKPLSLISVIGRSGIEISTTNDGNRLSATPTIGPDGITVDTALDIEMNGSNASMSMQSSVVLHDGEVVVLQASMGSESTDFLVLAINLVKADGDTIDRK